MLINYASTHGSVGGGGVGVKSCDRKYKSCWNWKERGLIFICSGYLRLFKVGWLHHCISKNNGLCVRPGRDWPKSWHYVVLELAICGYLSRLGL